MRANASDVPATPDLQRAEQSCRQALRANPFDADACRGLGDALYLQGRLDEAAHYYGEALKLRPDDPDALNNLGATLADLGRLDEALPCYQSALRLRPEHADAHYNLGNLLRQRGAFAEAEACYGRALRLRPGSAEAFTNLGLVLHRQARFAEAETAYRQALRLNPRSALAHNNLGLVLADSGRLSEALACYDEALRLAPEFPDAHRNRGLALLLLGDWERGWPEYDWRWRCSDFKPVPFRQPLWDGSALEGRTILLHAEQGLGDTLQFIRFAGRARGQGGRVIVSAREALHPILAGVSGVDQLVPPGPPWPEFDVHYPLMSLPGLFGITPETIPTQAPYLSARPALVERWRDELAALGGFQVGISWAGSPGPFYDRFRSIPLKFFARLARVPGVRLISLQKGPGAEQLGERGDDFPVIDLGPRLDEDTGPFLDTAAVLLHLDLVITCDSSLTHLAGAMGVPTWVVLPRVPDWRWLLDREDSPWYPHVRLFRQELAGSWKEPFARIEQSLKSEVKGMRSIPIGVSPGELLDRITILEIKSERIVDEAKLANVCAELDSLIDVRYSCLPRLDDLAQELRAVNEAIWDAEDALRRCEAEGDFGPRFIEQARSIYRNNDRRARLKRQVNDRLGWGRPEEKQHPAYEVDRS